MLMKRIYTAVTVFVLVYGGLWIDSRYGMGWCFASLQACFCTFALREFYRMARTRGLRPFVVFGYIFCVLFFLAHEQWCMEKWHQAERIFPAGMDALSPFVALAVVGCLLFQIFTRSNENAIANVSVTLTGLLYCFYLFSFLGKIRHLGLRYGWEYDGVELVFLFLSVTKVADVGGLLIGTRFGRHALCPNLSPKKTWEGFLGGIAASILLLTLFCLFEPRGAFASLGWPIILTYGFLLGVTSLFGDLVESAFKRDSERKDAGTSIPGFGGVLDMVDSLMIAAPIAYYFLLLCGARHGG